MVWFGVVGVVVQFAGIAIAVLGVSRTHAALFGEAAFTASFLRVQTWFTRKVLRRPGRVVLGSADASIGPASASGRGVVRPARPGSDATLDEQVAFLRRMVDLLAQESEENQRHAERLVRESKERFDQELAAIRSEASAMQGDLRQVREALVGRDGGGLRLAAWGLSLTAVGLLITIPALPW